MNSSIKQTEEANIRERMQNIVKLNDRLNEENASLLNRCKNLQATADSTTTVMERLASRETTIEEQREVISHYTTQLKECNDKYAFIKAENEAMTAQLKTDSEINDAKSLNKIENLKNNLDCEMNNSLRLMQENQDLRSKLDLTNEEHNQKLLE